MESNDFDGNVGAPYVVGGLYSMTADRKTFYVFKVLRLTSSAHIRVFSNCFSRRPRHIDESWLFIADDRSSDAPAARYAVVTLQRLAHWRPRLIQLGDLEPRSELLVWDQQCTVRLLPLPVLTSA